MKTYYVIVDYGGNVYGAHANLQRAVARLGRFRINVTLVDVKARSNRAAMTQVGKAMAGWYRS